jgi:hypothetical protein
MHLLAKPYVHRSICQAAVYLERSQVEGKGEIEVLDFGNLRRSRVHIGYFPTGNSPPRP